MTAKIDAYFEYRMLFGEACKLFGKSDHMHEYPDDHNGEVFQKSFKADEKHLDPDAPLIREAFDRNDPFAARHPKRISDEQTADIIRDAAIAAGVRKINEGQPFKRHNVMMTHGFRKLFKKRCRQAKVDPIILERFLGHKSGNPKDGISKLMMTYDPEEWAEMQAEFEKAIPKLTITKDAITQTKLEEAEAKLKNVPAIENLQGKIEKLESMLTKSEADRLDLFPPKIENADKKTPLEVLVELFSKGHTTVPLDKLDELYTSLIQKEKRKEEPSVVSNESELVNFIPSKELAAELCRYENQKNGSRILP